MLLGQMFCVGSKKYEADKR